MITKKDIRMALQSLKMSQTRCNSRCLDESDIDDVVELYRIGRRIANRCGCDPLTVRAEIHGGHVPNSYAYKAETTVAACNHVGIAVYRRRAQQRAFGRGPTRVIEFERRDGLTRKGIKVPKGWTYTCGQKVLVYPE